MKQLFETVLNNCIGVMLFVALIAVTYSALNPCQQKIIIETDFAESLEELKEGQKKVMDLHQ